ncbi:M1 family metallopeptidase [Cuniculiplasma sp. SKW3]|uniref:M1 family metallopeptidase n=1 Tax=Cuniculiplasma sp. SKW3 TaxID=3400170 RepID=UPI003FD60A8A
MKEVEIYHIKYKIDIATLTFSGTEIIKGKADGGIWLNSVDMEIPWIKVNGKEVSFKIEREKEIVNVDGKYEGDFELELEFKGKISDGMNGIYYSKEEGFYFVSTQFESTGARFAFPCVDHPAYKAIFELSLDIPSDYDAISNMPAESVEDKKERKIIRFMQTPKMSTYLLYIGAAKYDMIHMTHDGKPVYLAGAKGKFKMSEVPIKMANETLDFYEDYFNIKYQLPKLHLIAVPEFAFGAMENWGAITFREIELMVGESTSSAILKRVDEVISHELAHQWFGDLVTMKWWDDLWLNESFATFMSYKALEHKHPEWEIFSEFVTDETERGMTGDSLRNTHPIHVDVKNPDEISQIFDEISYSKGGSILRMIEAYVGKEHFRNGVRNYLKENSFSNAIGENLWNSIEKVSGMPVSKIMNAWITMPGYPVINVTSGKDSLHLKQERFFMDGSPDQSIWPIPLTIVYEDRVEPVLMDRKELDIKKEKFLYINQERTGFYRIHYDDEIFQSIRKNSSRMDKFAKLGLISDSYAYLMSGKGSLNELIDTMKLFMDEDDYILRDEIVGIILQMHNILLKSEEVDKFGREYIRKHLQKLGDQKPGEPINVSVIRGRMQSVLTLIDPLFAKEFAHNFKNLEKISPDSRQAAAYAYAISENDPEGLISKFNSLKSDEDKVKIISATGYLKGNDKLEKVWELIESGKIKKQDSFRFISSASLNFNNRPYIADNMERFINAIDRFFAGTGYTSRFLETMIPYVGLSQEKKVDEFVGKHKRDDWGMGIKKGLEYLNIYKKLNTH